MDRRAIWAIILMMLIAVVPSFFLKKPPAKPAAKPAAAVVDSAGRRDGGTAGADSLARTDSGAPVAASAPAAGPPARRPAQDSATAAAGPEDTITVRSGLYTYAVSTRGARLVAARMHDYQSTAPGEHGQPVELVRRGDDVLAPAVVVGAGGRDTVAFETWRFEPSTTGTLDATAQPQSLTLRASRNGIGVELTYTFRPGDYRIGVAGRVSGLGQDGGLLLVSLGDGVANTEADTVDNHRAYAFVTKNGGAERTDFAKLDAGERRVVDGPFEWVAVKSKYFVNALLAFDTTSAKPAPGRIGGVVATAPASAGKHPTAVHVRAGIPLMASGEFAYQVYAGPMEYGILSKIGHDFDDVNPYGWPGFRTVIRFFAVPVRALLVWMHEHLALPYGLVLIVFGILVRVLLWPLNSKAMRSQMAMQAIQPELKRIQEKYSADPQRQQQEMFKLYKEHNVNPLGGCWPMLLPMPVLLALFFVFQYSIELRGTPFLWVPDLSRPDPLYIIPVVMALSMFLLSKVGQIGMPANPQAKMMTYVMPVMMLVFFYRFAAGLNLYYAVSNIASIPQQWMLARERQRRDVRQIVEVKTKAAAKR
ncbi:MAG TPA: membrane protein insertase YidC [Gemmatimonadales bacterium]|nr:membrane protein insertase YidC [Gemmatimonadales bacterium]